MRKILKENKFQAKAVLIGILVAVMMLIVGIAVSTALLINGGVGEESKKTITIGVLAIAVSLGTLASKMISKRNPLTVIVTAGCIWVILLSTGLILFDGGIVKPWIHLLISLTIGTLFCATCMKKGKTISYKKLHIR